MDAPNSLMNTHFKTTRVLPEPDLYLHPSRGAPIPVHANILASASPVLDNIIMSNRIVKIHGVPYDAVIAFLRFLYSSRCTEEEMDKYGMHLLALSHVYMVPQLKRRSIKGLTQRVNTENVVDVLQLARLCDAPDLYLKCIKLLSVNFKAVEKTEGWRFLQRHDPWLELDILRFMHEHESRKKKCRKQREDEGLYMQLSEAMECLEHICMEGCTNVGPYDVELSREKRRPCSMFATCQRLQVLICHFATCKKRVNGGCLRCKRTWQLFRLHSFICQQDSCKVPLCRQIQLKMQQENRKDDARWKLLARKVASVKAISSLSVTKRKRNEEIRETIKNHGIRVFKLQK